MNKFFQLLLVALSFIFQISCNQDDEVSLSEIAQIAEQQHLTSAHFLKHMEGHKFIEKTSPFPEPTSDFIPVLIHDTLEAIQGIGASIKIDAVGDFEIYKVFFRFLSMNDDKPSEKWFEANNYLRKGLRFGSSLENNFFAFLDIPLEKEIGPGIISYELLVELEENNQISQPVVGHVQIEAWGGNSDVEGVWLLDSIWFSSPLAGKEEILCEDSSFLMFHTKITQQNSSIEFRNDGSNLYNSDIEFQYSDHTTSRIDCKEVWKDVRSEESTSTGKWFYNNRLNNLSVVHFQIESNGSAIEYETPKVWKRQPFIPELMDNQLILRFDNQPFPGDQTKYFFHKK